MMSVAALPPAKIGAPAIAISLPMNGRPMPTQLREIDCRAERHDEQAGNDVAKPGDLRVVDQCARQDAAPEACKQQDRNAEHRGEYCFGFLRNQLADCVDAE